MNYINRGKYAIQLENLFNTFSEYMIHIAISEDARKSIYGYQENI